MSDVERLIMLKVERMLGRPPVGMLDLLHILVHPDVITLTKDYVETKLQEDENPIQQS